MNKSFKYLPPNERKKILLICDDIRVHSGVATVAKEIVTHTCQHFNWVNVGGAIKHPENGKRLDLSADTRKVTGVEDASVFMYCTNGYGTTQEIHNIINMEKPDAVMLFTDPRYFLHIFNMEDQIRKICPIAYLNIWDDYPAPRYNQPYYEACDLLMGISKQTVNINKLVLSDCDNENRIFKYIPHGLDHKHFYPIREGHEEYNDFKKFRSEVFKGDEVNFVTFFNSRNIRRKQIPDTMMAFRLHLDSLELEEALKCRLVLHTELSTDHGTDLEAVKEYLFGEKYNRCVVFSTNKLDKKGLNYLYNLADVQTLCTSNEGWGLTLTEAMLSGTPIIANTTGGMQDQMRFVDDDGNWFTPNADIPSNHRGTFKKHGEWAFPVYPTNISIQGSPMTPYIYDDRASFDDISARITEVYNLSKEEREARGLKGREWCLSEEAGFYSAKQGERVIEAFDELFEKWKPRADYELIDTSEVKGKYLNHKITY